MAAENIIGEVITEGGRQVKFGKDTGRKCPACDKNTLRIRADIDHTASLECPSCAYLEHVPSETVADLRDMKGRPVKKAK